MFINFLTARGRKMKEKKENNGNKEQVVFYTVVYPKTSYITYITFM